jgi:hypothetical protein
MESSQTLQSQSTSSAWSHYPSYPQLRREALKPTRDSRVTGGGANPSRSKLE